MLRAGSVIRGFRVADNGSVVGPPRELEAACEASMAETIDVVVCSRV